MLIVNKAFAEEALFRDNAIGKRIDSGATSNRDAQGGGGRVFRQICRRRRKRPPIYGRPGSRADRLFPIQTDAVGSALGDCAHDAASGADRCPTSVTLSPPWIRRCRCTGSRP